MNDDKFYKLLNSTIHKTEITCYCKKELVSIFKQIDQLYTKQEAHGPNRSPEISVQLNILIDYIITLIKRKQKPII